MGAQHLERDLLARLKATYTSSIGAEFMHIVDSGQRHWFAQRLESVRGRPTYSADARSHLLERLTEKYSIDVEYHCKPLGDTDTATEDASHDGSARDGE